MEIPQIGVQNINIPNIQAPNIYNYVPHTKVYPFYDSTEPRISVAGNMAWM